MGNDMTHTYTAEQLESGALRLTCPTCGRVIVVRLKPYERKVEAYGDVNVAHVFGADTLGLKMGAEARQDE
jgi:DNA-directed RNA polymerase subunit N (RpoN/RPB10)